MESIYDLVSAPEIATYWDAKVNEQPPFLGETLFPNKKQIGRELKWLSGSTGSPIALRPSALDADVIPRKRQGFSEEIQKMIFFKESKYVDEDLRQQLLMVQSSVNTMARDAILQRIFDDSTELITAAQVRREIMRMDILTTGTAHVAGNGQDYSVAYDVPANHKETVSKSWSDDGSNPFDDIEEAQDTIGTDTGATITRAIMNRQTFNKLKRNATVKATLFANNANTALASIPNSEITSYIADNFGLSIAINNKGYVDGNGKFTQYVPDDVVVYLPEGDLGSTWFGTTPEEADLMAGTQASVSIVDTGVAVTTSQKVDPVQVETKVSMMALPSFEQSHMVYIQNTKADVANSGSTGSSAPTSGAASSASTSSAAPKA